MFLLLLACTSSGDGPDDVLDDTAGDTAGDTSVETGEDTGDTGEAVSLPYSGGTCPALGEDLNSGFVSGEAERKFRVILPADPEGAGVVYAWHWLGGNSRQLIDAMELDRWADELGFIVVAPDSSGEEDYEWDFLSGPAGNADGLFFEDLRACVHEQWGTDLGRQYATGMSAGGLWTTWLTLYKADVLTATAPLSGGTNVYLSPDRPIPVVVTWGGPNDLYQGYSFEDASLTLSEGLQSDGHFVVECVHDGGHTIPREATDYVGRFFVDHPEGVSPEPYLEGLPAEFPEWCGVASGS